MKNSLEPMKKNEQPAGPLTIKELSKLSYDELRKLGYSVANPASDEAMKEIVKLKTEAMEETIKENESKQTKKAARASKKVPSAKKISKAKAVSKAPSKDDETAAEPAAATSGLNARVGKSYSRDTGTPTQGSDQNAVLNANVNTSTQEMPEAKNENVAYDEQKAADTKEEVKKEESLYSDEFTKNIQTLYLTEESRLENLGLSDETLKIRLAEFKKRILEPMLEAELDRTGKKIEVAEEKEVMNPELKTLHDSIDKTREDYIKGLVKFQKLNTLKSKISGMLGGSNEKKNEAEQEVKDLKEKYDKARTELNTKLYREKKAQLEESGMSHGKIQTELANFRIEMLKQISFAEMALVTEKRAEQLPKSRLAMFKNAWDNTLKFVAKPISIYQKLGTDWGKYQKYNKNLIPIGKDKDGNMKYYKLGQLLRTTAMSTMFSFAGVGMLGVKLVRSVGTTVGGSAAIDKLGRNINEKKLDFAKQKEELVGKFSREEINLSEYETQLQVIEKAERKAERYNNMASIAVAGLMVEANLAGGSGHMFGIDTHTGFNLDKTISDSLSHIGSGENMHTMEQAGHFVNNSNTEFKPKIVTNPSDNTRVALKPNMPQHHEVPSESLGEKSQGWFHKIGQWFSKSDKYSMSNPKISLEDKNINTNTGGKSIFDNKYTNPGDRNIFDNKYTNPGDKNIFDHSNTPENTPHQIPKEAIIDSKHNVGITYALKSQIELKGDAYAQEVAKAIGYNGDTHNPEFYKALGEKFGYLGEGGGVGAQAGAAYELGFDNSGKLSIQEYGVDGKATEIHYVGDNGNDLNGANEKYEYKYSNVVPKNNETPAYNTDELKDVDSKPEVNQVERAEMPEQNSASENMNDSGTKTEVNNVETSNATSAQNLENANVNNTTEPYELKSKDVEVGNNQTNNELSDDEKSTSTKVDPYKLESKGIQVGTHPTDQNTGGNNINSYYDPYGLQAKGIQVGNHPTDNGVPHRTSNGPHPTNNTRSVIDIINERRMGIPRGGHGGGAPHDQYPDDTHRPEQSSGKVPINGEPGRIQRIKVNKAVDYIFGENRPSGRHIDGLDTREWSKLKDMSMKDIEEKKHWFPLNQRNNVDQIKHIVNASGVSYMKADGTSLTLKEYLEKIEAQSTDKNFNSTRYWLEH